MQFPPRFIQAPPGLNVRAGYGQHYRRFDQRPGRSFVSPGLCVPLSIAWLRNVLTGHSMALFPMQAQAVSMLAALYGNSTRILVACRPHDPALAERYDDVMLQGMSRERILPVLECLSLSLCLPGFQASTSGVIELIGRFRGTHLVRGFMVMTSLHTIALAMDRTYVGMFDCNRGITICSWDDALETLVIRRQLVRLAPQCEDGTFKGYQLKRR